MKKLILILLIGLVGFSFATATIAEEDPSSGPDIRISPNKKQVIEEYRSNGRLYMIKITPKKGPPYYLIDADGDGDMETRRNDLTPNLLIPTWVLFSW